MSDPVTRTKWERGKVALPLLEELIKEYGFDAVQYAFGQLRKKESEKDLIW